TDPSLVLLDEPSQGLAPPVPETIVAVLRGVKRRGLATLLAEQSVATGLALPDRAARLQHGVAAVESKPAQHGRDQQSGTADSAGRPRPVTWSRSAPAAPARGRRPPTTRPPGPRRMPRSLPS